MAEAAIMNLRDCTSIDAEGAVRSVQEADLLIDAEALERIWSPLYLERLARTYWRFLSRVTLGLVRVYYTETERSVVLLFKPLKLLTFAAPEYSLASDHGVVRWRIRRGVLVARAGHDREGHLQIDVRRPDGRSSGAGPTEQGAGAGSSGRPAEVAGVASVAAKRVRLHVEVEVANFYPALGIHLWFYNLTQSRIHVLVTRGFLRSLARLDLARSRVGRLALYRSPGLDDQPKRESP